MNETLTLRRLAELIANTTAIPTDAAESFAKSFFAHIEDALAVTDRVDIDGLGSFVRNSDLSEPVKFIPDEKMAAALNRPFAMFTPVTVGEDDIIEEESISETNTVEAAITPSVVPTSNVDTPEKDSVQTPDSLPTASESATVVPEPIIPTPEQPLIQENEESDEYYTPVKRIGRFWLIILFIFGLIIGTVIGYIYHDDIAGLIRGHENSSEFLETDTTDLSDSSYSTDTVTTPLVQPDTIDIKNAVTTEMSNKGVEVYDTVTPQRFLTTMARQYYGPMEYWVFIYEANSDHLGHPNRIKPGTVVHIPNRETFTNGESEDEILLRAKRMGKEIYSRFE